MHTSILYGTACKENTSQVFLQSLISVREYGSYKCNVKWPPTRTSAAGCTGGELATKEKSPSRDWHWGHGRNRKCRCGFEDILGAALFQSFLLCRWWRVLLCMEASSCPWGRQPQSSAEAGKPHFQGDKILHLWLAVTDGLQLPGWVLNSAGAEKPWHSQEKKVFLVILELSSSFHLRLTVCHNCGMLLTHGEMLSCRHERQVLLFGAGLLFGGSCEVITDIFNRANTRASPSSAIPVFKIRKRMKAKWHLSPLKTESLHIPASF